MDRPRLGYGILGPVELHRDGRPVPLRGRHRALLARLLLERNRIVPAERIVEELWGGKRMADAANTVQVNVSQLRKQLDPAGVSGAEILLTRPPGYLLLAEPDDVDADRFERLLEQGRTLLAAGDAAAAGGRLREALALWRGPALADVAYEEFAQFEIRRLEELRLTALAERIEADLGVGKASELVGELEALAAQNPLAERFREQLMLAFYRSGRQAAALEVYQDARRALVEELGLEPGQSLQRLERAILQQEAWLEPPEREAAAAPAEPPAPVEATPRQREVRKTVTVLHARVELAAEGRRPVDLEESRSVLRALLNTVEPVVRRHGGTLDRHREDAIAVLFGTPVVHEDDPLRAVHTGRELLAAVEALATELSVTRSLRMAVHVGVSTAAALLAESSEGGSVLAGGVTTSARQLSEAAAGGEILLSEQTHKALAGAVHAEPTAAPATQVGRAWRLVELLAAPGQQLRRFDARLVGRQEELAALSSALKSVSVERRCRLFTILGAAGMGKSRLAREFRAASEQEATFLSGRCLSYGEGISFWPLIEIVRQAIGDDIPTGLSEFTAGDPERERLEAAVLAAAGQAERPLDREEMFWGIRRLLERLARQRTLVLLVDDLHWAEPTLLDLIEHLLDWVRDASIFILCLARPELLDRRPAWGGGKMNATTLLLAPLTAVESRALIAELIEGDGAGPHDQRIVDAAEGNPLFIEQLLAMADQAGGDELTLPPTVEALLAARLDLLSSEERETVDAGAVIGRVFWSAAVAELVQRPLETVRSLLNGLIQKQLVRPADSELAGEEAFCLEHQLIRDVAYSAQPQESRAGFHERFADWLEASTAGEHEEILAYHLEQAHRLRLALDPRDASAAKLGRRAAERLRNAGRRAYARGDVSAAANLLERALALDLPDTDRPALLVELGDALRDLGEFERSEAALDEAIERASGLRDRAVVARASALRLRLRLHYVSSIELGQLLSDARGVVAELAKLGDERALAEAWTVLAWIPWVRCRAEEAEEAVAHALEHARRGGDEHAENFALVPYLGTAVFGPRAVDDALQRCSEVLARERLAPRVEAMAYRACAALKGMIGEFDEARELLERDRALVENLGLPVPLAMATEVWGMVELLAGEPAAAEAKLREGLAILTPIGEMSGRFELEALLAEALYAQERYDEALGLTAETMKRAPREDVSAQVRWRGPRAKCLARRGATEEAERLAREAVAVSEATDFLNLRGNSLSDLAEVLRLAKRRTEAAAALKQALALYTRKGSTVAAARTRTQLRAVSPAKKHAARSARTRAAS